MVKVWEITISGIFVVVGWIGVDSGEMYNRGVPVLYPRQFGWVLIVLGVSIPVAAYIMRSRQGKGK